MINDQHVPIATGWIFFFLISIYREPSITHNCHWPCASVCASMMHPISVTKFCFKVSKNIFNNAVSTFLFKIEYFFHIIYLQCTKPIRRIEKFGWFVVDIDKCLLNLFDGGNIIYANMKISINIHSISIFRYPRAHRLECPISTAPSLYQSNNRNALNNPSLKSNERKILLVFEMSIWHCFCCYFSWLVLFTKAMKSHFKEEKKKDFSKAKEAKVLTTSL